MSRKTVSRNTPFNVHVARGLLTVIGEAGLSLGEATGSEEPEEVLEEPRESRSETPRRELPHSESAVESADKPEGDLAARRLFALAKRAEQGKAEPPPTEPPPTEPPPTEPPPAQPPPTEPPPAEPPPAEPPPAEPPPPAVPQSAVPQSAVTQSAVTQSAVTQSGEQPALDRGNRAPEQDTWRQALAVAKAKVEDASLRVVGWLEARLAVARRDEI